MESFQLVVIVLIILITVLIYIIVNLLKTVEKYEDITQVQESILNVVKEAVNRGSEKLKEHDRLGHYNAEDDLGDYFKMLLEIDTMIREYLKMLEDGQT